MARTAGFAPVGELASEFEAEALAEVLRGQGFLAVVHSQGGLAGQLCAWVVSVPFEDGQRALQAIIGSRAAGFSQALARCPECQYSLEGLEGSLRCPECACDLESARLLVRTFGAVVLPETRQRTVVRAYLVIGVLMIAIWIAVLFSAFGFGEWADDIAMWSVVAGAAFVCVVAMVVRRRSQQVRRARSQEQ